MLITAKDEFPWSKYSILMPFDTRVSGEFNSLTTWDFTFFFQSFPWIKKLKAFSTRPDMAEGCNWDLQTAEFRELCIGAEFHDIPQIWYPFICLLHNQDSIE